MGIVGFADVYEKRKLSTLRDWSTDREGFFSTDGKKPLPLRRRDSVRRRQQLALGVAQRLAPLGVGRHGRDGAPVHLHGVADAPELAQVLGEVDERLVAAVAVVLERRLEQRRRARRVTREAVLERRLVQRPVILGLDVERLVVGLGGLVVPLHLGVDVAADGRDEERIAAALARLGDGLERLERAPLLEQDLRELREAEPVRRVISTKR